jgi:(2Fe-2S) ferredoxin
MMNLKIKRLKSIDALVTLRNRLSKEGVLAPDKKRIRVCCGTGCRANKSMKVAEELKKEAEINGNVVEIVTTGCQGLCQKGPVMIIDPEGYFYQKVQPERVQEIVSRTISGGKPIWDLLFRRIYGETAYFINDVPFYGKQERVVLRHNGYQGSWRCRIPDREKVEIYKELQD